MYPNGIVSIFFYKRSPRQFYSAGDTSAIHRHPGQSTWNAPERRNILFPDIITMDMAVVVITMMMIVIKSNRVPKVGKFFWTIKRNKFCVRGDLGMTWVTWEPKFFLVLLKIIFILTVTKENLFF